MIKRTVVLGWLITIFATTFATAQVTIPIGVPGSHVSGVAATVCVEPRISFTRTSLSFDPWSGTASKTLPELNALWRSGSLRLRYTWTPKWVTSASLIPGEDIRIGDVTFSAKDTDTKPVSLNWSFSDVNRVELSTASGDIRPVMAIRWQRIGLRGTQDKDGKLTEATHEWSRPLWSGGLIVANSQPGRAFEFSLLGGDRYLRAEALAVWAIANGWLMNAGYRWEEAKYEGVTVRQSTPFVGITVER